LGIREDGIPIQDKIAIYLVLNYILKEGGGDER